MHGRFGGAGGEPARVMRLAPRPLALCPSTASASSVRLAITKLRNSAARASPADRPSDRAAPAVRALSARPGERSDMLATLKDVPLLRRGHLPERGVGELPALLPELRGEQGDGSAGHERPRGMPSMRAQCRYQLGSGTRIRRPEESRFAARWQWRLRRRARRRPRAAGATLDVRAAGQEHVGRLTVERPRTGTGAFALPADRRARTPAGRSTKMSVWTFLDQSAGRRPASGTSRPGHRRRSACPTPGERRQAVRGRGHAQKPPACCH